MDLNLNYVQEVNQFENQGQGRKKCHGNRKDQRFRKKCRARGMKLDQIEKLLQRHKRIQNEIMHHDNKTMRNTTDEHVAPTTKLKNTFNRTNDPSVQKNSTTNPNKRKRDISLQYLSSNPTIPKSSSSISIVQPSLKKMKNKKKITISSRSLKYSNNGIRTNYRSPKYLKRSPYVIMKMLSKTLNYTFKENNEKQFICIRLNLLDQYYFLRSEQELWNSYIDVGIQQHLWPDRLFTMAKSNDFEVCHQYLMKYLRDLKKEMDQCQIELVKQSQSCPFVKLSLDQIDQSLNEFVDCQRKYLSKRNNRQLSKFKDNFHEKKLFENVTKYHLRFHHNEYMNELLIIRQKQGEIYEELLKFEMRILCKFLPEEFDHLQYFIAPMTYTPLNDVQKAIQLKNNHHKIIQEAKRRCLTIALKAYNIKLQDYENQYENKFLELESQLLISTMVDGPSIFNQIKEYMAYRTNKLIQDIYKKVSSSRRTLLKIRQSSSSSRKDIIGVSPEPYLDLMSNPFNTRQWNHLSLGPSFIRLNQSAIRPRDQQEILIEKEHKQINDKVEDHLISPPHHVPLQSLVLKTYSKDLLNYFNRSYFAPISYQDHVRAIEQATTAKSIRRKLNKSALILRITDKGHNFYVGSMIEFEKKVRTFFQDTNAFVELTQNPFNEILTQVIQLLNRLREKNFILAWQYKKMMPDRTKCELAHLYFNPKTHKEDISVRPIENTIMAATTNISNFLDEIIRPIFNSKCSTTTIIDGVSLIKELITYAKRNLLKPTTLFCTIDIRNLYTMLPQEESLNILVEFLHVHGYKKVKGIPLDTIRKLASIVLKENVFVYDKKIYKQVLGGAMGSSFTLTLANIFMWKWQKEFVRRQDMTGEFYGRYIDDIFMTWNKSEKVLKTLLDEANTWHPNIKIEYKISTSLPFLDVLLTNNAGVLSTSLYHKPAAEPYILPYISDHPRHTFANVIHTSLVRAIRYSSTFEIFNHEQCHIKLTLLLNG
ncbi:unnamed protein product [Rotaria sp. Silwood2]|nr:unnamed protein product [Rotaria sp. Silwood2]CAF3011731.1 unnamed protein product [Rotaria sp. Silwood2]CAF3353690.1 unnamed protein product [Rotaria sp. Silwood2]CAF4256668.1 unnamed protein product [Rotaria sp. Silwood2]